MGKADKRARKRQNQQLARQAEEAAVKKSKRRKQSLYIGGAVVILVAVVGFASITGGDDNKTTPATTTTQVGATTTTAGAKPNANGEKQIIDVAKTYTAKVETNFGDIELKLDAKNAPIATNHFITLVKAGYYDGLTWHRVKRDFMIQGGDKKGDGTGEPESSVIGEVPTSAYPLGAIAAAKTAAAPFGSFGDQFFIVTGPQGEGLPPEYATWGVVTKGLDVAKTISELGPQPSDDVDRPTKEALIKKITYTES